MISFIESEYMSYVWIDFFKKMNFILLKKKQGILAKLNKNFSGNNFNEDLYNTLKEIIKSIKANPAVSFSNYTVETANNFSEEELLYIKNFSDKLITEYCGKSFKYNNEAEFRNAIFKEFLIFLNLYPEYISK